MSIEIEVWEPVPDREGYSRVARRRTNGEVTADLRAALEAADLEPDEYLSCLEPDATIPKYRWIACYTVTGGSEGHYIHVEVLGDGMRHQIALGKTFAGMQRAQAIANFCGEVLGA